MPSTKQVPPVRMIRGKGASAVTHYSCGAVDKAKKSGAQLVVIRKGKEVLVDSDDIRSVHRSDPCGKFGDTHECAGDGKFISSEAFSKNGREIRGAHHINPYLREDGPYFSIIETFKKSIGERRLARCAAQVAQGFIPGIHLLWDGKRNSDGFLPGTASEWMTKEEVWTRSLEMNSELQKILRRSKSGRKGVKLHRNAKEKFFIDLDVLLRATCTVNVATGERKYGGGCSPYSKPLEQMGFAIDKQFLTYGADSDGNELAQYHYRFVVGRSEPHILPRTSWVYEGIDSSVAFKNEAARRQLRQATKRATAA